MHFSSTVGCGYCGKKKIPQQSLLHKNNNGDLCCEAVASISDKPQQWGVNAASLIHDSLSVSFWTAEMSPCLSVLSAAHWTCHYRIIAPRPSGCPCWMRKENISDTFLCASNREATLQTSCPNYKIQVPLVFSLFMPTHKLNCCESAWAPTYCNTSTLLTWSASAAQTSVNTKGG